MYSIVVLSLIAVALLAMGRRREGLQATSTIKNPIDDPDEMDRIYSLVPETEKTSYLNSTDMAEYEADNRAQTARNQAGILTSEFYRNVYTPATAPITQANIDSYLAGLPGASTPAGTTTGTTTGGATGATGTSTPGAPANPQGASSTTGTPAPAPGLYIQLKTEFDTKKSAYDALIAAASRSTNPTDADINQLRTMNRELFALLEQTIQALSTIQSEELGTLNRELAATLNNLERQYSILSENADKVETLRRIRGFEETKSGGNVGTLMIALLVVSLAMLVIMMFSQRTKAPATAATMTPPSMANFT
jgi:hypothetical protein